ncbi:hypothetical protein QGM60_18060 [Winogradskyella sp. SYSU M77433]|nr:hypothetical protein [Winogradskyella sp. SYSU M77433]
MDEYKKNIKEALRLRSVSHLNNQLYIIVSRAKQSQIATVMLN